MYLMFIKHNVKILPHILYKMPMTVHHALGTNSACVLSAKQYETFTSGLSTICTIVVMNNCFLNA